MNSSRRHAPTHPFKLAFAFAALFVTLGCANLTNKSPRREASLAPAGVSVLGFGFSVLSLEREQGFLRTLGMSVQAERSVTGAGFEQLLGLPRVRAREQTLGLGDEQLFVTQFELPTGRSVAVGSANDVGFEHVAIVVRDMDTAYALLTASAVQTVSAAPQTLPSNNASAAGVRAMYFRDPEGHFLELIQFPPGKGETKWQRPTNALFMGIDHSAIVSTNTEASLVLYRDVLGMRVVSQSINVGLEQERLSQVDGARVRVTSLRGAGGPGIELLEYLSPRDGQPLPELSPADTAHWEIMIEVHAMDVVLGALRSAGFAAPARCVELDAPTFGKVCAALARDPDGHCLRLVQRVAREPRESP